MTCLADAGGGRGLEEWAEAFIFALDGVIADTDDAHAAAWQRLFDDVLPRWGNIADQSPRPFDITTDDRQLVEGRPAVEGVARFLRSRGITIEAGAPDDGPARMTLHGLGNRKNAIYRDHLDAGVINLLPSAVRLIRRLKARHVKIAVVSSGGTCRKVLDAAEIADLFDVRIDDRVDGGIAAKHTPEGNPAPDIHLRAAGQLGVPPGRTVVVESSVAGVQAGRSGAFGCVIGVDRHGRGEALMAGGADRVVNDLAEIDAAVPRRRQNTSGLPDALDHLEAILDRRPGGRRLGLVLDYDGTLTPIAEPPDQAELSPDMRSALAGLSRRCTLAVVSERASADIRRRVDLDGIHVAGRQSDKGRAVGWLTARLDLAREDAQVIYIGDDITDEDAFRAVQGHGTGIVVKNGRARPTHATYSLASPRTVQTFLERLAEALGRDEG